MAEGNSGERGRDTLPQRGKVNQVCKQWLVHEDGALAYELQNAEIDRHYGLNRYNRRTVREDIPVARVVQTDEEVRQQQERFQELEALKAQFQIKSARRAEEDEEVARRVTQELMSEEAAERRQRELEDEELARNAQEKEKKKYEKYMEKKRIKELKREREILEKQLEQHTQDARLVVRSSQEADVNEVQTSMNDMAVSGRNSRSAPPNGFTRYMYRVTPSGRIEDEGDFTDFFAVPDNIPEEQRAHLQALQDEELARLLQEQEHKRTKAEVDRMKLREIEEQDERLAKIIQEQEKLRAKRAKEKRKQQEESRRQSQQQQMTNPATRPLPDLPGRRNSSDPPVNKSHDHHRLRRESFLQSIENWSSEQPQSPQSEQSTTSSRNSQRHSARQNSRDMTSRPRLPTPDEVPPQHAMRSVEQWVINSARETQNHQQQRMNPHRSDEMIPSPSPPGSYHSEDELPYRPPPPPANVRGTSNHSNGHVEPCYAVSNPIPFNIATAIDPTYRRQASDGGHRRHDDTDIKMPVLSSSMPIPEEFDMEWDPSLRGSLRRPKGSWNPIAAAHYHDQTGRSGRSDSFSDEGPVISPFQPVQGQRRSGTDKQKSRKSSTGNSKKDKQGNCKQQ